MSSSSEHFHHEPMLWTACGKTIRWTALTAAGTGITILLFTACMFLGGTLDQPPVKDSTTSVQISDVYIPEPERELVEFSIEVETEIPRMNVEMDVVLEVEPPPMDLQFTVNPALDVGVSVPPPPAMMNMDQVFGVMQLEVPPRLVSAPPPSYPRNARRQNRQGVVRVMVTLDRQGNITNTRLVPGPDVATFGDATLEAVRKWRFTPGKIGNRPVNCEVEIPVEFNLQR